MNTTALILELVHQKGDSGLPGRIALQKLVYFTKVLGKLSSPRYKMYIYGPFSDDVANTLQDCVSGMLLVENDGIRPDSEFDRAIVDYQPEMDKVQGTVGQALEIFGSKSTKELELMATTHFVFTQQRHLYQDEYDKNSICNKVKLLKGSRFSDTNIYDAYDYLNTLGMLDDIALR